MVTIYRSENASSNKANDVTQVGDDDLETIVRVVKANSVAFDHSDRPRMYSSWTSARHGSQYR